MSNEQTDLPTEREREPPVREIEESPTETIEATADGIRSFRRLLTEIAKVIGVLALIFLAIVVMILSWEVLHFVMGAL